MIPDLNNGNTWGPLATTAEFWGAGGILILLGLNAPSFGGPAESVSTFLTLATGPLLRVLLFDPSRAWWEEQKRITAR